MTASPNQPTEHHALKAGLEGVVAGVSKICKVDGEKGELFYWGYNIHDLAQGATFEETVYLLLHGELPKQPELLSFSRTLNQKTFLSPQIKSFLKNFPKQASPMAALRTAVSGLGMFDIRSEEKKPLEKDSAIVRDRALFLVGQVSSLVAGFEQLRKNQECIDPKPEFNHAENFLYMMSGKKPNELQSKAFNIALVLHADHELNASTFAARVTAATLADIYSAATSAIGALEGPLHGGANEAVMKLLLEIKTLENTEKVITSRLAEHRKIPGFGHRVYHAEDPRATHLRQMAKELGESLGNHLWYDMLKKIEEIMWREKKIYSNVDCYSAAVYHLLGIPTDLFTPIFAVSRMAGWMAHVLEQYSDNRLIRPRAEYIGPENRTFVPLDKR